MVTKFGHDKKETPITLKSCLLFLCINLLYIGLYINFLTHLIHKQLSLYVNLYIKNSTFLYCAMASYIPFIYLFIYLFSNHIDFGLKNISQEFLLFLKSLNKDSIQYFTIELLLSI